MADHMAKSSALVNNGQFMVTSLAWYDGKCDNAWIIQHVPSITELLHRSIRIYVAAGSMSCYETLAIISIARNGMLASCASTDNDLFVIVCFRLRCYPVFYNYCFVRY